MTKLDFHFPHFIRLFTLIMSITLNVIKSLFAKVFESPDGSNEYHSNIKELMTPEVLEAIIAENTRMGKIDGRSNITRYDVLTDFFVSVFCYSRQNADGTSSMINRTYLPNENYRQFVDSVYTQYTGLPSKYRDNNYTMLYAPEQTIQVWVAVGSE